MIKNKINFNSWVLGLVLFLIASACTTPQDLLETGNYDQAVTLAVKKLSGKKKKKAKHVDALEKAFAKAIEKDMDEAERLKREGRPENWERINDLYRRVRYRQDRVKPLLPLIDQHGIKADFRFVRVEDLERESKQKAAEYLYAHALQLMEAGQEGDKLAARKAYKELEKIDQYYKNYKDRRELMNIAKGLGTTHILIKTDNVARVTMPRGLEREITEISLRDLNSFWKEYHLNHSSAIQFDYEVILKITNIDVSPSLVKEREYEEHKEIEEGFEYVLDEKGNVKKDSLGNDIKVPKKVRISARVFETFQSKAATVTGKLEFIDLKSNNLIDTKRLTAEAVFENYASTFRGDKRALSGTAKNRIGNRPLPFPTDESLIYDAAKRLKPVIKDKISGTRILI